ncbi:MAG: hypothetical protein C5B43_03940 [Verrucomicrobia bacterium]|nr:MAG: hypothetical protein C5B43_03940 [Verrucomicrobiota bacterium]
MSIQTFTFSTLLIILGLVGYFGTGMISIFALIPAGLGLLILICGLLALSPRLTKTFMHIAVMLSFLGFIFTSKGIVKMVKMLMGVPIPLPQEAIAQSIMSLLCLVYVFICFRWFLNNRRKKSPRIIA